MIKQIAKIKSTSLGFEDHGVFTAYADVDYGGTGQGIGGYGFSSFDSVTRKHKGSRYGMEWIMRFIKACGVETWEQVKGRTIMVLKEKDEWGRIIGIEPLPTEPGELFMFDDLKPIAEEEK